MGSGDSLVVDGSSGEGGGQLLRSSLALAALTGRSLDIVRIRAKRRRPGLQRQHLAAAMAVAEICGGELSGASLGAQTLAFTPGAIAHGDYRFAVGSAGSATLVFQAVLWPLLAVPGRSRLVFAGGTHNPLAPPFDFLAQVFLPRLRALGVAIEARLEQAGFFPAGGGRFVVELEGGRPLAALQLRERGKIHAREAVVLLANLPRHIAERELAVVERELGWPPTQRRIVELNGPGPGNALCLRVTTEFASELVTGFGEKGVRAETVARRAVEELRRWLDSGAPVGEHLADQLLMAMALAAGDGRMGEFVTVPASSHTRSHAALIERFLPVRFAIDGCGPGRERVRIQAARG